MPFKRIIYGTAKQARYRGQEYRQFLELDRITRQVYPELVTLRLIEVEVHRRGRARKTNMEYYLEYANFKGEDSEIKFYLIMQIPDWFYDERTILVVDQMGIPYFEMNGNYLPFCHPDYHRFINSQFVIKQVHSDVMIGKILTHVGFKTKITTEFF